MDNTAAAPQSTGGGPRRRRSCTLANRHTATGEIPATGKSLTSRPWRHRPPVLLAGKWRHRPTDSTSYGPEAEAEVERELPRPCIIRIESEG